MPGSRRKYSNNPDVWFGTANEPDNSANLQAIPDQERAIYDAVRGTGSKAMVMLEERGGGFSEDAIAQSAGTFATMTNVAWDTHYYGWLTNYSTDPNAIANSVQSQIKLAQSVQERRRAGARDHRRIRAEHDGHRRLRRERLAGRAGGRQQRQGHVRLGLQRRDRRAHQRQRPDRLRPDGRQAYRRRRVSRA